MYLSSSVAPRVAAAAVDLRLLHLLAVVEEQGRAWAYECRLVSEGRPANLVWNSVADTLDALAALAGHVRRFPSGAFQLHG